MSHTLTTSALILKRSNVGEADRVVTLLTQDLGKITVIAKGARKMSSSKRGYLEPGNIISAYLIKTRSMPLLTQARLVEEFADLKTSLLHIKKLSQILEIADRLLVEEEESPAFGQITQMLYQLKAQPNHHATITRHLEEFLLSLGFQDPKETIYRNISDYVSSVAEKPLRSYEFLTVKK